MESSLQQANHLSIWTKSLIKQKITSNKHFNNGPSGFGSGFHGLGKWDRYGILGYTSSGSKKSFPPLNGLVSTTNGLSQPVYKTHIHDPPYRTHNMHLGGMGPLSNARWRASRHATWSTSISFLPLPFHSGKALEKREIFSGLSQSTKNSKGISPLLFSKGQYDTIR